MLCGGKDRHLVAPEAALSIIDIVDHLILIRTEESADETIQVLLAMPELAGMCSVSEFPGSFDFCCDGRNFALAEAARFCEVESEPPASTSCWQVHIDTDERMQSNGLDIRQALAAVDCDVDAVLLRNDKGEYPKARFIRLPAIGKWTSPFHEDYIGCESFVEMNIAKFSELPKSQEEQGEKMVTLERLSREWIEREPKLARVRMHLGNTLLYFRRYEEAAAEFIKCAELSEYDEERAWALFRAGECSNERGLHREAIKLCSESMATCPYFPEAPFLAAFAAYNAGRHFDALAWADVAIALGKTTQLARVLPTRTGFSLQVAHWEGPWRLRALALADLETAFSGDPSIKQAREQAEQMAEKAEKERTCFEQS